MTKELRLNDKLRGMIFLTLKDGVVVGASGSEPKRYVGLTEAAARHLAHYGRLGAGWYAKQRAAGTPLAT